MSTRLDSRDDVADDATTTKENNNDVISSPEDDDYFYDDDDAFNYDEQCSMDLDDTFNQLMHGEAVVRTASTSDSTADCASSSKKRRPTSFGQERDPENFEYECLQICDVERLLNESVEKLCQNVPVTPSLAKLLLYSHKWQISSLIDSYRLDCHQLLVNTHIKPPKPVAPPSSNQRTIFCSVCCRSGLPCSEFKGLACGHQFCQMCWASHCAMQLGQGVSTGIQCMDSDCRLVCPEDFGLKLLSDRADLRAKYQHFVFQDHVKSHPELRFCSGADCPTVIRALQPPAAKKVACKACSSSFCFKCGIDYHAPTSCETMKRWLMKCADDSETANYISAHTKDCPNCHACIEKNGGCNHMQCAKCKHHFCWMCFGDWRSHGSEYYECSRYKENPQVAQEAVHVKARKALEKYLHYFERWENHNKSLKMEEQLKKRIIQRIDDKVNKHEGTWIDWQYLHDAATLLTKCRYTLQYTYPYAYYMESGPRKELFEYQQAQLEKEIEELSWKVERAESTDRGDMESQMNVAEKKRQTLLQDFFE